jgi:hypothetical protein
LSCPTQGQGSPRRTRRARRKAFSLGVIPACPESHLSLDYDSGAADTLTVARIPLRGTGTLVREETIGSPRTAETRRPCTIGPRPAGGRPLQKVVVGATLRWRFLPPWRGYSWVPRTPSPWRGYPLGAQALLSAKKPSAAPGRPILTHSVFARKPSARRGPCCPCEEPVRRPRAMLSLRGTRPPASRHAVIARSPKGDAAISLLRARLPRPSVSQRQPSRHFTLTFKVT